MLRALLGEQSPVGKPTGYGGFFYEGATAVEQNVVFQQLSNRCCLLEEKLPRLEEGNNRAVTGSAVVVDENVSTTVGDQKVGKKKGSRRNKVAPCKTADLTSKHACEDGCSGVGS